MQRSNGQYLQTSPTETASTPVTKGTTLKRARQQQAESGYDSTHQRSGKETRMEYGDIGRQVTVPLLDDEQMLAMQEGGFPHQQGPPTLSPPNIPTMNEEVVMSENIAEKVIAPHRLQIGDMNNALKVYTTQLDDKMYEVKVCAVKVLIYEIQEQRSRYGKIWKKKIYKGCGQVKVPEEQANFSGFYAAKPIDQSQ